MKQYNLFISHSWNYPNAYDGLVGLLKARSYFEYRNYSVSRDDPIHVTGTDAQLRRAIHAKMAPCGVILILAGVYATYSKWIKKEIDLAKTGFLLPKPIVAIEPWGSEKTSAVVKEAADRIVRWRTDSIVRAIRELA